MRIGGFIPFTLTDFPGRVAAIVFTQGCNFHCPYCHNQQLIPLSAYSGHNLSEEYTINQLKKHTDKLDGVVVSGGEPTIQEDLICFLYQIRSLGLEAKLDTNGSRPSVIEQLFAQHLLCYVAMDIKAPLVEYYKVAAEEEIGAEVSKSIDLIAHSGIEHEFRTTWDKSLLSSDDIDNMRMLVPMGSSFYVHDANKHLLASN